MIVRRGKPGDATTLNRIESKFVAELNRIYFVIAELPSGNENTATLVTALIVHTDLLAAFTYRTPK